MRVLNPNLNYDDENLASKQPENVKRFIKLKKSINKTNKQKKTRNTKQEFLSFCPPTPL